MSRGRRRPDVAEVIDNCQPCIQYFRLREAVVIPELVAHARATDSKPIEVFNRYAAGVHARHLAGLSLEVNR